MHAFSYNVAVGDMQMGFGLARPLIQLLREYGERRMMRSKDKGERNIIRVLPATLIITCTTSLAHYTSTSTILYLIQVPHSIRRFKLSN